MGNPQRTLCLSILSLLVTTTLVWAEPHPEYRCPGNLGIYADQNDRSYYWICVNYVPFHQQCPAPLEFDQRYQQCKLSVNYVLAQYQTSPSPYRPTSPRYPPYYTGGYESTPRYWYSTPGGIYRTSRYPNYQTTRRGTPGYPNSSRYPTTFRYQTTRRGTSGPSRYPTTSRNSPSRYPTTFRYQTTRRGTSSYPSRNPTERTTRRGTSSYPSRYPTTRRASTRKPTTQRGTSRYPTGRTNPTTRRGTSSYPSRYPTTRRASTRKPTTRRGTPSYPSWTGGYETTPRSPQGWTNSAEPEDDGWKEEQPTEDSEAW